MKNLFFYLLLVTTILAQDVPFSIEMEELPFSQKLPALQSFSLGEHDGEWLIVGGLSEGTHGDGKQVFAGGQFPAKNFNTKMWVVAPDLDKVWSVNVPEKLRSSLNVANPQYCQISEKSLCIVGGYGFNTEERHDTIGIFTSIDIPSMINAIKEKKSLEPHLWQIFDSRLCVTGGELKYINNEFFLVAGQKFRGKYMEDEEQEYTLEIRRFQIDRAKKKIVNYTAIGEESLHVRNSATVITLANKDRYTHDLNTNLPEAIHKTIEAHGHSLDRAIASKKDGKSHLRRRDLNVTEAIFPDGTHGFILYGGGFKFLFPLFTMHQNPIFFSPKQNLFGCHAMIDMGFEQTMSLYTCANMLLFDSEKNSMHTVLFGGISSHVYDSEKREAVRDRMLPYVNNISVETVSGTKSPANWKSKEKIVTKNSVVQTFGKKSFFGTNAKFVLSHIGKQALHSNSREIMDISKLKELATKEITIGYIYGGIQALKQNFGKTQASKTVFAVKLKYKLGKK